MSSCFSMRGAWRLVFVLSFAFGASGSVFGDEAEVLSDKSRIVSIGGAITEIVFALGKQDVLVARDSTSVYPEAAFALPDVGYMRQLSPEGVLSVNPTGILALQGSGPREAIDVLKKTDVPFVEIQESWDREGISERIRSVGKALGEMAKAEELAADVDKKLDAVAQTIARISEKKRVLFILSAQGGKILASGTDTAANGVMELAGAVNAVNGYEGYKQLADEAIIEANPDFILMMTRAGGHETNDDELLSHPAIAVTPAGINKRLIKMDGAFMLGFGPRTVDAIMELAETLYGKQDGN